MSELVWTRHPVLPVPTGEQLRALACGPEGAKRVLEVWRRREEAIARERQDPLRSGYELPHWKRADALLTERDVLLVLGGNRSGKSEYAAKWVMRGMMAKPGACYVCMQSSDMTSRALQQPYLWRMMPPELRLDKGIKTGRAYIAFSQKNGFTDNTFILPNGSQVYFMNYNQDIGLIEGWELDGFWCDELAPVAWVEGLTFRLVTRKGKGLVTFTPVHGYTTTVAEFVAGAEIAETREAKLFTGTPEAQLALVKGCPAGHVPYVMRCRQENRAVIFFHTEANPYNDWGRMKQELEGATLTKRLLRAYGWTEKTVAGVFPKFSPKVHVVAAEKFPIHMDRKWKGTRYRVADPAGARNWFIVWYLIDEFDRIWIYREFPDHATYGEWALPDDKPDGKAGPAQFDGAGRGIKSYKQLILEAEGWRWDEQAKRWDGSGAEEIEASDIDPRMGSMQVPGVEDGTSIIDLMANEDLDKDGAVVGPSMTWVPCPAVRIEEGFGLVNDLLEYDETKPVDVTNSPRLFVLSTCKNLIYALQEYTGRDGEKGALKDPADCLRYLAKAGRMYVDTSAAMPTPSAPY